MKIKRNLKPISKIIDLTPLIDVVFLLLVFFMLSSTFILQPGIKINLPESNLSEAQKDEDFNLYVLKDGTLMLNNQKITESELVAALKSFIQNAPAKVLIIRADKNASHGDVVKAMGLAKKSGVMRFAIATKPGFDV